jgi:hypothetical protein
MADESIPSTPTGGREDRGGYGGQGQARGGRPSGGRDGGGRDGGGREGRDGGGREGGGFRIRLSDNEMQAARALQEAFGLRSTVAVLGFSLRTLAQQLEQGQLAELIAQQSAQGAGKPPAAREGGKGGERRRDGFSGNREEGRGSRAARVDPFARPARPAAPPAVVEATPDGEPLPEGEPIAEGEEIAADPTSLPETSPEPEAAVEPEPGVEPEAGAEA